MTSSVKIYLSVFFFLFSVIYIVLDKSSFKSYIFSDAEGYYMYLPAVFIYGGFEDIPVRTTGQFFRYEATNKYFTKYTCGVALMQLPFFFLSATALLQSRKYLLTDIHGYTVWERLQRQFFIRCSGCSYYLNI